MASFKTTIFQKDINTEISKEQRQKILLQKSDFLVLPEFFPFTSKNSGLANLASNCNKNLDTIIEISMQYKGAVIGGSFIREEEGKYYHSAPIVLNGVLVDWYNQKVLHKDCDPRVNKGNDDDGIYILNGIRFAILMGNDITKPGLLEKYKKEGIQIVFHLSSDNNNSLSYEDDLQKYVKFSSDYNFYIFRTCGTGQLFDKKIIGRSLFSSPSGINWKVSPLEDSAEIIKTINLNL